MTRLLVCGGRDFADRDLVVYKLDRFRELHGIAVVIHGAARGADKLADDWALMRGVPREPFPADWGTHGKRAGPLRNARMLAEGRPDAVLAFPGGSGTADMCRQARAAGVTVYRVVPPR